MDPGLERLEIPVGELTFDALATGPGGGEPVLLLHGFPQSSYEWRSQLGALGGAGYRAVAPDQRGYSPRARPVGVDHYRAEQLVGDVIAMADALGFDRFHLVGHDWGAAVAWTVACFLPDRVDHLVVMSVGHPSAFAASGLEQREKSWYMLLFQFEDVAEQWLTVDGWRNFREWMPHPDADATIADVEATASLTTGLNWYRANVPPASLVGPPLELPPVAAATMGIWSTGDAHLLEAQMIGSAEHVSGPWRYERLDGPGHHLQLEQPDTVNHLLLDFLPA
jgi:pimeloyl-ACP methyl ester carboxylesterase